MLCNNPWVFCLAQATHFVDYDTTPNKQIATTKTYYVCEAHFNVMIRHAHVMAHGRISRMRPGE